MRILFSPLGSDATSLHRLTNPIRSLEPYGVENDILNLNNIQDQLEWASLVVFQCLMGDQPFELLRRCKSSGKKVVIDYDDCFDSIPEILCKRIGISQDKIALNWFKYLNQADLITVPSDVLARYIRTKTKAQVRVLPNFITKSEYLKSKEYDPFDDMKEVRVLYSCSESHVDDFNYILPRLKGLGENYKNVTIISHGSLNFTYLCPEYSGRAIHIPVTAYPNYFDVLRTYKPHIFIAPLTLTSHNVCRSNLKYLQSGVLKCAFAGENLSPYKMVSHNKTGVLSGNRLSWWWNLRKLVRDPDFTKNLGESSYKDVSNFILEDNILRWRNAYLDLIES